MRQTSVTLTPETDRQITALKEGGFGSWSEIVRIAIDRLYVQHLLLGIPVEPPPRIRGTYSLERARWPDAVADLPHYLALEPAERTDLLHRLNAAAQDAVAITGDLFGVSLMVEWVHHWASARQLKPYRDWPQVEGLPPLPSVLDSTIEAAHSAVFDTFFDSSLPS